MSGPAKAPTANAVDATEIMERVKTQGNLQEFKESLEPAIITTGHATGHTTETIRVFTHHGQLLYVCNKTPDCIYVRDTDVSVRSHMTVHVKRGESRARTGSEADPIKQIETYAQRIIALSQKNGHNPEVDRWKQRALTAEKELRELKKKTDAFRKAIGDLG